MPRSSKRACERGGMQLFRPQRTKIDVGKAGQKRLYSIVLVFCSLGLFYFGYRQLGANPESSSLKVATKTLQNLTVNNRPISLSDKDFKPLPFASVEGIDIVLYFPAYVSEIVGIGFHESEKATAITMQPSGRYHMRDSTETVSKDISLSRFPVLFVMYSRGRRQSPTSAVDIAVKPNTTIRSPVNGTVSKVEAYYLYGKYRDFKVEIIPENHPELRVAMIHLDKIMAKQGQRVYCGKTEVAKVRGFSKCFDSQINEYIPRECGHTHIQVNKYVPELPSDEQNP